RFKISDYILLSSKNIKLSCKISDKYLSPFKVISIIGNYGLAYRLELPSSIKIYNVFPVSLLEL
ncbi:hypothetical protein ACRALDRAFT_2106950, partial [Sodiomyces alcalophilus JCM 7366]|uniref:uncharacterized protein n=1 Tax=Sodiomyces alcalophilus JCM 7366 TaxID=591952 RepID=UPI0039B3922D